MGREFATNVKIFDKVDDLGSSGQLPITQEPGHQFFQSLKRPPVFGVIYLVKYFHIFCKFPSHVNRKTPVVTVATLVRMIRTDPVSVAGVFDAGKDSTNLFLRSNLFVVEVTFAALNVIMHHGGVEITRQQDRDFAGCILFNGSGFAIARGHFKF